MNDWKAWDKNNPPTPGEYVVYHSRFRIPGEKVWSFREARSGMLGTPDKVIWGYKKGQYAWFNEGNWMIDGAPEYYCPLPRFVPSAPSQPEDAEVSPIKEYAKANKDANDFVRNGTTTTQPAQGVDVDSLAQEIRRVDGSHSLGAAALAEALTPFIIRAVSGEKAAQAVDVGAVRRVIDELNYYCEASDGSCYGTLATNLVRSYTEQLARSISGEKE
jgi:hypothetical protein